MVQTAQIAAADIAGAGGVLADLLLGAPYIGLVANKCKYPHVFTAGQTWCGGKEVKVAVDDMVLGDAKLVYGNFYTDDGVNGEKGPGAPMTLNIAIEYPLGGTRYRVTWNGGATSVSIPDKTLMTSDGIPVSIPRGAFFRLHFYQQCANGILYVGTQQMPFSSISAGDTFSYGAAGGSDLTMAGDYSLVTTNGRFAFPPVAIIGTTRRPTWNFVGDSRGEGLRDYRGDSFSRRGEFERGIGSHFAYTNLCQAGESAGVFNGPGGALRRQIANAWASHSAVNYTINELTLLGKTATQVLADLATLYSLLPNSKIYQATIPPNCSISVASTGASSNTTTGTVVIPLANAQALTVGQTVVVAGFTPAGYNGTVVVTAIAGQNVSYTLPSGGSGLAASSVNGTVSDMGASLVFQTPFSAEAYRASLNETFRSRTNTALTGIIEISDQVESARNSGKWDTALTIDSSLLATALWDGLHENSRQCQRIANSAEMNPYRFRRGAIAA